MLRSIPETLSRAEFVRIRFHLEFQEPYLLSTEASLRLRRDLRQAGRERFGREPERLLPVFDPPLSSDPVALSRFQRPGPLFVLHPPADLPLPLETGDVLCLESSFWGRGIQGIPDFARVLETLGRLGLHRGEGTFELTALEGADPSGEWHPLWQVGMSLDRLAPPVSEARWHLETFGVSGPLRLDFLTPVRLLTAGRPLFRPTFVRLFPFILRRVTSMLFAACGLEIVDDPKLLLAAAAEVREGSNTLGWADWRTLQGETVQEIGGILGSLELEEGPPEELLWILNLGSLLNLGKGAAFGNGRYTLKLR